MAENRIAKPFLKWAGGKTQLIGEIENILPTEIAKQKFTYIEPFVGSGAILFWMLSNFPNIEKAIINDINKDLINTYNVIKNSPNKLIVILEKFEKQYHSFKGNQEQEKEYFYEKRTNFNTRKENSITQAAIFIFLNRTCFNGLYRVNRKNEYNVPKGRYKNPTICNIANILAVSETLQKVEILCGDYETTLKYANDSTLFYFDPPYKPLNQTSSFNSYAKDEFNDDEQIRLKEFCSKLDAIGQQWILSNSDVKGKDPNDSFFDELYADFKITRVDAKRSINANPKKRGKLKELLITNIQIKDYIPTLDFNKSLFTQNFDKAYWSIKNRVPIDRIKFEVKRLSFNNSVYEEKIEEMVNEFDLELWIPITVDKEFYLLDGQHRLRMAKRMGLKFIDVVVQNTELLTMQES